MCLKDNKIICFTRSNSILSDNKTVKKTDLIKVNVADQPQFTIYFMIIYLLSAENIDQIFNKFTSETHKSNYS